MENQALWIMDWVVLQMTPDDVVARAIELCEYEVRQCESTINIFESFKKIGVLNGSLILSKDQQLQKYKFLRSWQTHLAEFEEHENYWAYCCEECNGDDLGCKTCSGTYPCQIAELKAKRLMGEE